MTLSSLRLVEEPSQVDDRVAELDAALLNLAHRLCDLGELASRLVDGLASEWKRSGQDGQSATGRECGGHDGSVCHRACAHATLIPEQVAGR